MDKPAVKGQGKLKHWTGKNPRNGAYHLGKHPEIKMQVKWENQEQKDNLPEQWQIHLDLRAREACENVSSSERRGEM